MRGLRHGHRALSTDSSDHKEVELLQENRCCVSVLKFTVLRGESLSAVRGGLSAGQPYC